MFQAGFPVECIFVDPRLRICPKTSMAEPKVANIVSENSPRILSERTATMSSISPPTVRQGLQYDDAGDSRPRNQQNNSRECYGKTNMNDLDASHTRAPLAMTGMARQCIYKELTG